MIRSRIMFFLFLCQPWYGLAGGSNPATLPPTAKVSYTTDTSAAGTVEWEITGQGNKSINRGQKNVKLSDIKLIDFGPGDVEHRLDLGKGFYLKTDGVRQLVPPTGFALAAGRDGEETFCWEWFEGDGATHATKLQETGLLEVQVERSGNKHQITRTRFATDVSLRVHKGDNVLTVAKNLPAWRVNIKKGSEIRWPLIPDTSATETKKYPFQGRPGRDTPRRQQAPTPTRDP